MDGRCKIMGYCQQHKIAFNNMIPLVLPLMLHPLAITVFILLCIVVAGHISPLLAISNTKSSALSSLLTIGSMGTVTDSSMPPLALSFQYSNSLYHPQLSIDQFSLPPSVFEPSKLLSTTIISTFLILNH